MSIVATTGKESKARTAEQIWRSVETLFGNDRPFTQIGYLCEMLAEKEAQLHVARIRKPAEEKMDLDELNIVATLRERHDGQEPAMGWQTAIWEESVEQCGERRAEHLREKMMDDACRMGHPEFARLAIATVRSVYTTFADNIRLFYGPQADEAEAQDAERFDGLS